MSEKPVIAWAKPADVRVAWQAYVNGVIKVRQLNSGVVQVATGDQDWRDAE
jgi:hypothetical protein